jgi:hypothetical protein
VFKGRPFRAGDRLRGDKLIPFANHVFVFIHHRVPAGNRAHTLNVGKSLKINVGETIEISCGKSLIKLDSEGNIFVNGVKLSITGEKHIQLEAKRVDIN